MPAAVLHWDQAEFARLPQSAPPALAAIASGLFVCRGSLPILRLNNRAVPIGPRDDPLDPRSLSQFGPVNSHHVLYRHLREQPIHRRRHRGSRP
jgi:hypothetical protein